MIERGIKGTGQILIGNFRKNDPQIYLIKIRDLTLKTVATPF